MLIWFKIKAAYLLAICLAVAFVWGMIAFIVLSSFIAEETLAELLPSFWLTTFGFLLIVGEQWWKKYDPHAQFFFAITSLKRWGVFLLLLGLFLVGKLPFDFGFSSAWFSIFGFSLILNLLIWLMYRRIQQRS